MRMRCACLLALLLVSGCDKKETRHVRGGPMAPPAFWVWHRSSALKPDEKTRLKEAGVHSLYWQAAECEWKNGGWQVNRIATPMADTAGMDIIPVFRLKPESAFLGSPDSARLLADQVRDWSGTGLREIQIDFDCPDRLLESYAGFLESFGQAVSPAKVSITALASWPRHPKFGKLARAVSSFAPMFYDLEADPPAAVKAVKFRPMAARSMIDLIKLWSDCPRPWLAGLPNFERLSVFEASGKLTGHLRGWNPDPVLFHPGLKPKETGEGITVFEILSPVEISGTKIPSDGILVHRKPDTVLLHELATAADHAGAAGIVYFALPGPGIQAACSAAHLCSGTTSPRLLLTSGDKGQVILHNQGPADLTTQIWEIELSSPNAGAFRSASPGAFAMSEVPGNVPAEFAGTLVLKFSRLRAGELLASGPILGNPQGLVWKIRGLTENQPVISNDSAR